MDPPLRSTPGEPGATWRYRLGASLGAGAGGRVHEAWDPRLKRTVAVKLLRPVSVARVLQEARAQARLTHPAIVPVYDFGRYETDDGDPGVFIVMERVEGQTLREWLAQDRSVAEIVAVFKSAAAGLAAAHEHGLVHRDFKPSNVMVTDEGAAKVLDFGLARLVHDAAQWSEDHACVTATEPEPRLTQTGTVMGTPKYMAPEQYTGADVGPAADQFAFCQVFLEALRGAPLFPAADYEELAWAKRHKAVARAPKGHRVPRHLERVLLRGLEPDPADRWPSLESLVAAVMPRRARATWIAVGLLGLVVPAAGLAWYAAPPACTAVPTEGVWTEADRASVRDGLAAAAPMHGRYVWMEVESRLEAKARQWERASADLCEPTARASLSGAAADGRASCLRGVGAALRSTIATLAKADAAVADQAVEVVASTPDAGRCTLAGADGAVRPQPLLPEHTALVEVARATIVRVGLQQRAGNFAAARETLAQAERASAAIAFEPLRLELMLARQECDVAQGRLHGVESALSRLLHDADSLGYVELAAKASTLLGRVVAVDLERVEAGTRHLRRAESFIERLGRPPGLRVELLEVRATIARVASRLGAAEALRREQLDELQREDGQELRHADVLVQLGLTLAHQGRYDDGREAILAAMKIQERLVGPLHPRTGHGLHALARVHLLREDRARARGAAEQAVAIYEEAYGADHPAVAEALIALGDADAADDQFERARGRYERARAILVATYGEGHSSVGAADVQLGAAAFSMGEMVAAESHYRRAMGVYEQIAGSESASVGWVMLKLGRVEVETQRRANGERRYGQALRILEGRLGGSHPHVAAANIALGHVRKSGPNRDIAAAEEHFRRALSIYMRTAGEDSVGAARSKYGLATAFIVEGETERARARLAEVVETLDRAGETFGLAVWARRKLATLMWGAGEYSEAFALMETARAGVSSDEIPQHHRDFVDDWLATHPLPERR